MATLNTTTITTPSGHNVGRNILNTLEERLLVNIDIKYIHTTRDIKNKEKKTCIRYTFK